jgi:hypothetical protein
METMTKKMKETLFKLETGSTTRPYLKSAWDSRTIDALERRGLISVRDYDGEIRVTSLGNKWCFENNY